MRISIKKCSAMTLVELLTATIIVGIIMLGIFSIELAMRRTFSTTSRSAALSMRVSGTMLHYSRNISRAIGDRSSQGLALETNTSPDCLKLYVRQDNSATPADYSDDTWIKYEHDHTSTDAPLTFCSDIGVAGNNDPVIGDPGCGTCPGSNYELMRIRDVGYNIVIDDVNLQYYTEVILSTYYDNTQAVDPIRNPSIENMQTKINYMSHSW